jgi:hypothetical protein
MPDPTRPWSWKYASIGAGRSPDGIYLMIGLALSGLTQIVHPPKSVADVMPRGIIVVWGTTTLLFALLALVGILLPMHKRFIGLYFEGLGRGVLAVMCGVFVVCLIKYWGLVNALVNVILLTYVVVSCGTRAWHLYRKLRHLSEVTENRLNGTT